MVIIEHDQRERLLGKAIFYLMKTHFAPRKGLSVYDEHTDTYFCVFMGEDNGEEVLLMNESETLTVDLVECDVVDHLN